MDTYQEIHDLLFRTMHEIRARILRHIKEERIELTPMHHKALVMLHRHPGETQRFLVQCTGRDKSQIHRITKELETRELIRRDVDPADKRRTRLFLSSKGQKTFERIRHFQTDLIQTMMHGLNEEEVKVLKKTLSRMKINLQHINQNREEG